LLHDYVRSVQNRWPLLPQLSRWFIRTALIYLLLALLLGLAQLQPASAPVVPWPTYVHLLVLGWLTQLIFGVAHWMFPRSRSAGAEREWLGWSTYLMLNAGLILRSLAESGVARQGHWFVIAALLQLAAGWSFVIAIWPRVRGR